MNRMAAEKATPGALGKEGKSIHCNGKRRALATPGGGIGKQREAMYKQAFSRIKLANQAGFYLESITIIESLISVRLESRLSFLLKEDFSFKNLGKLIDKTRSLETDAELKDIVSTQLNEWRTERNSALHERAKIACGDLRGWEKKYADMERIAVLGASILHLIQNKMKKLHRTASPASPYIVESSGT